MLRLCKIGYVTLKNVHATGFINFGNRLCGPPIKYDQRTILQRFYSKKGDKNDKGNKSDEMDIQKRPAPFHDCKSPNLYDQIPTPDRPWIPFAENHYKRNRTIFIIGIISLLTTIFVIYMVTNFDQKVPKLQKVDVGPCKKGKRRKIIKNPSKSKDIPREVPYLLIGGGTASFSAFRAIKSSDPLAKVLVISEEDKFPYMRPPLSKEIWYNDDEESIRKYMFKQWNGSERSLFYEPSDFYLSPIELKSSENGGVAVALGWKVKSLDVINNKAILEDGYEIRYEKCLIATGATPRSLDLFVKATDEVQKRVTTFRTICDFEELYDIINQIKSVAIIGGGFLGSELACSLARYSKRKRVLNINHVFKEKGNMGHILPEYLSEWTTKKVREEGVNVFTESEIVEAVFTDKEQVALRLTNGHEIIVDHVILAIGVTPNTNLAEAADLEIDSELGGYLVNTELQARTNLYIAGDCVSFYDPRLGRRRIEHHDHAVVTGRLAGENMTGAAKPYIHQSMYWSDLGPDVGFEAIGIVDSSLPTVGVFASCTPRDTPKAVVEATGEGDRSLTEQNAEECPPSIVHGEMTQDGDDFGKGVIFYLRDDIIVGIVLWNVFNRMPVARQVLKDQRKYEDLNEVAKLFNIHDD